MFFVHICAHARRCCGGVWSKPVKNWPEFIVIRWKIFDVVYCIVFFFFPVFSRPFPAGDVLLKYDGGGGSPHAFPSLSAAYILQQRRLQAVVVQQQHPSSYACARCGNSYARLHSLSRHVRFECGVDPKFECPVCHKKSKHKHNLLLHMKTHLLKQWSTTVSFNLFIIIIIIITCQLVSTQAWFKEGRRARASHTEYKVPQSTKKKKTNENLIFRRITFCRKKKDHVHKYIYSRITHGGGEGGGCKI